MNTSITTSSVPVQFNNINKIFTSHSGGNDFYAVRDLTLTLEPGELVTLLGPSGCGKTTTLRMLAGFEIPTSGTVTIGEQDMTQTPPNKRNVGMMFQSYALFPHLTVYDNIAYGLRIKKVPNQQIKQRVADVLALMQLEEMQDRQPSLLSGGQQQRVALARAIVTEPKVLLFDEPLSNLDAKLREYMRDELRKIQQRLGITSLYVTHDQSEAMAISDKVVIMNKGLIEQIGTPYEIYTKPVNKFVADFMGKAHFVYGQVLEIGAEHIVLSLLEQAVRVERDEDVTVAVGDEVVCMIRPEFWHIAEKGEFVGTVDRAIYLGTHMEYAVSIGGQLINMVDYLHHQNGIYKEGEVINLRLDSGEVRILPEQ